MQDEEQPVSPGRKWGASTGHVIEAIQNGCRTLRAIADYTGICYRSVNAIVTSLEKQDRVIADTYHVRRREQLFRVIHAEKHPVRNRGFVEHPKHRDQPLAIPLLGVGATLLPTTLSRIAIKGRIHRLL